MKLINLFPLAVDEDAVVSKTIENCLKYIFNFANVPSTELFLPTTGITLDTFFTMERTVWDIAQELTDSISDSFLYIDEIGIITIIRLTNARQCIETTRDDFNAGEKTLWVNVNVDEEPGAIITEIEGGNILNGDMETRVVGSGIIDGLQYWTIYPTSNGYYGFHYNTSGPLEGPHGGVACASNSSPEKPDVWGSGWYEGQQFSQLMVEIWEDTGTLLYRDW